jgi:phosphoribosylformylglycinamidine synthase
VWEQYDHTVQTHTMLGPGRADAALLLPGTRGPSRSRPTATGRYTYRDLPRRRARVVEAARNVTCVGARPLAITDCLNFGNPRRTLHISSSSRPRGIAEVRRALTLRW